MTQHIPNFVVVKQTKSVGISILLTFLFGPIGLFYASVTGGLVMTFTPFLLFFLLIASAVGGNLFLYATSFGLLILFGLTWWLICIIWGTVAVNNYNFRIISDSKRQQILYNASQQEQEPVQQTVSTNQASELLLTDNDKPTLADWRKENPHRSINDYYQKFGNTSSHPQVYTTITIPANQTEIKKSSNGWKTQSQPLQIEHNTIKSYQEKINQLTQLKQLLDNGVLTREEFDEQKSRILTV